MDSLDLDWCDHAFEPSYNVAPGQRVSVVVAQAGRGLTLATWGFRPPWSTNRALIINARTETLAEKPLFATALQRRRCLVPATGYFEWSNGRSWYLFRASGQLLTFAGLLDRRDGVDSLVICTLPASTTVRPIHPRMPAVVPPSRWADWLDCSAPREAEVATLPQQTELRSHEVHPRIGDIRASGPSLIEEYHEPTLFGI